MADVKYEKLDRIREDIKRDKAKVAKLQEQLGEFLALIQSGNLNELLSGKTKVVNTVNSSEVDDEVEEDDD